MTNEHSPECPIDGVNCPFKNDPNGHWSPDSPRSTEQDMRDVLENVSEAANKIDYALQYLETGAFDQEQALREAREGIGWLREVLARSAQPCTGLNPCTDACDGETCARSERTSEEKTMRFSTVECPEHGDLCDGPTCCCVDRHWRGQPSPSVPSVSSTQDTWTGRIAACPPHTFAPSPWNVLACTFTYESGGVITHCWASVTNTDTHPVEQTSAAPQCSKCPELPESAIHDRASRHFRHDFAPDVPATPQTTVTDTQENDR